ncbi:hypothetical protein GGR50DRAFT_700231 [Xylaria sp. CBS 124048]|nr:hypothetical protein GGR50DRAFT_700231 [Xylaria sp. CBS 124048]
MAALKSIFTLLAAAPLTVQSASPNCRCFPGDDCWPSADAWKALNQSTNGGLVATVPIASVCHDSFPGVEFDAEKCADIQANWAVPDLHEATEHSPMAAFWANVSCDPFTSRESQCIIGTYVPYAVKALTAADYQATIAFARENNLRLVIRNTGHDYMGKSTGAGALALWTHFVSGTTVLDYDESYYTGKAMKIGAGVQAGTAQAAAKEAGYMLVEGDCETVGIAGGYTQGGGSSPLGSAFGLGADQVLEWEVVTAEGQHLVATPVENSDLYWALSGGGGGTYAAVLSMTVKLHKNMPTGSVTLTFTEPSDEFWTVVAAFLANLPSVLQAGATVYWQIFPGNSFLLPQSYFPGGSAAQLMKLMEPTFAALNASGVQYASTAQDFPTFQDSYNTLNLHMNVTEVNLGGRLVPTSLIQNDQGKAVANAIRTITDNQAVFAGISMDVSKPPTSANAANPYWRQTAFLAFFGTVYDRTNFANNLAGQKLVTDVLVPALANLTPNGAAYLNEADFNQPDWQQVFYGENYARLLSIKQKYDPNSVFYGKTAVGSEEWEVDATGRLCKVGGVVSVNAGLDEMF